MSAAYQETFMRRCFSLAQLGIGKASPNPLVGCVIVGKGRIVAEGYHHFFGGPHAEVVALAALKKNIQVSSDELELYVNLEPCDHYGKTPPCTQAIIDSGIRKVVVSNTDPNPLVAGKGIEKLKSAGISVTTGILKDEGAFLNRRFLTTHQLKRPYVILKWAQSSDGFIAPSAHSRGQERKPYWISSEASRLQVQKWRSEEQAVLVGRKTVEDDDPRLTCRYPGGTDPIRVIMDPRLSLDLNHQVFAVEGRVIILNQIQECQQGNLEYILFHPHQTSSLLKALHQSGIQSIIVEGGRYTFDQFLNSDLWDEARVFISNRPLSDGIAAPEMPLVADSTENIGTDMLRIYYHTPYFKNGH